MPNKPPRVLLVDDDSDIYHLIDASMASHHVETFVLDYATTPEEAVKMINEKCYDACVLDVRLRGFSGLNLGELIREHDVNIPMVYLTNLDTPEIRCEAVRQRAMFVPKHEGLGRIVVLLKLIEELAQLNPCLTNGVRIDNHKHPRKLAQTPLEIPPILKTLVEYASNKLAMNASS